MQTKKTIKTILFLTFLLTIGVLYYLTLFVGGNIGNTSSFIIVALCFLFSLLYLDVKNLKILTQIALLFTVFADIFLVLLTIILPIFFIIIKSELQLSMVPVLILLYIGFRKIDNNAHKLYLKHEDKEIEKIQGKEDRWERGNKRKISKNAIVLLITGIVLFVIGNLLGSTLENLCLRFNVPQFIIGVILGFVTSIPELITFFESQKHHGKSKNNILGVVEATNNLLTSNMMNLFLIQSMGVIIFNLFN